MSVPILTTKLYIPPPPPNVVLRPRLIERLSGSLCAGCKLNLICAPAGFGKTTLASRWITVCGRPAAWLSLDEGDNDPARFLKYLVAALQTIHPGMGKAVARALGDPQPPPLEMLLTALLNEIAAVPHDFILVLDDYHVIDARAVDEAVTFLLEHLPPQMHLVVTSREDPRLPLARLRARQQLTELRAADLRFTSSEAGQFLQAMGLQVSAEDVAALDDRTEGWAAGLQLAALSMQGREDVSTFVRAFAGDNRYVVDYLVEEVLRRQPEPVRSFLLQTAILQRLCGPLCDAVTGQAGGGARLAALERGNFFVVPLDQQGRWYRYHHLFAEVLQVHLAAEQSELVAELHRRASEWYAQHGSPADAIRHGLEAGDFDRTADLIELTIPGIERSRQEATLLGWLRRLPEGLLRRRPVLNVHYAGALLGGAEVEGVEARLAGAERWLDPTADRREMRVADQEALRRLPGSIAMYRAGMALLRGDVDATIAQARRAVDLVPEEDDVERGGAAALLGLAYWARGELEAAHRSYADGMAMLQRAGHITDAINGAIALANIRLAQGRLREAMSTYEGSLRLARQAAEQGAAPGAAGPGGPGPGLRGAGDMYVGMSQLLCEGNDLPAARQHLVRSKELGEHAGLPQNRYRWYAAAACLSEAEGDLDEALGLLDEAERLYVSDYSPNVRPIAAMQARVWVKQGRLREAFDWAREQGLSAKDDPGYLREFEHITFARALLARRRSDGGDDSLSAAAALLERLLKAAEAGGRLGSAIEILVLQALACHSRGNDNAALRSLERALALAEPEGYVRIFVDEGAALAPVMREAAQHGLHPDYAGRLLAAIEPRAQTGLRVGAAPLVEPLSQRELEVLRLLRTELSGPEMAGELMVSLNTLRTHTKNIYGKLGVTNRRAAVHRAAEHGLL